MEYSQLLLAGSAKFSPNSEFFVHFHEKNVTVTSSLMQISNSAVDTKQINQISLADPVKQAEISSNSKYVAVLVPNKCLIYVYAIESKQPAAKIEDFQAGITSMYWVKNSLQLMVFSELLYKVSIYNLVDKKVAYLKYPKFSTPNGHAFSSDGKFLAMLEKNDNKDCLTVYYTLDWSIVNAFKL